jgi:hypothetical protein
MEKQTAVEWLVKQLKEQEYLGVFCTPDCWGREEEIMKGIVQQAKEMEKQQIINCYNQSWHFRYKPYETAEKYYNETFGK